MCRAGTQVGVSERLEKVANPFMNFTTIASLLWVTLFKYSVLGGVSGRRWGSSLDQEGTAGRLGVAACQRGNSWALASQRPEF